MKIGLIASFSILGVLLICAGCGTWAPTWRVIKTNDHRRIVVLNNLEEAMPPFGKDWSAIAQATVDNKADAQATIDSNVHELYETMDQNNAQLRNFLVASYAWYINTEMDTNQTNREKGREKWMAILNDVFCQTTSSRELLAVHGEGLLRMKNKLEQLFEQMPALEFYTNDIDKQASILSLKDDTETMEDLEHDLPDDQKSDVVVIAKSILEYEEGDYGYSISRLPRLNIQMPITYYVLAAAYARAGQTNEAIEAAQNLQNLGEWSANPNWKARGLMLKGTIALMEKDSTNALSLLQDAAKADEAYWPTYYNMAAAYLQPEQTNHLSGDQITNCIIVLRKFELESKKDNETVVGLIDTDEDHFFNKLIDELTTNQTWQPALINDLQNTNWPPYPPK